MSAGQKRSTLTLFQRLNTFKSDSEIVVVLEPRWVVEQLYVFDVDDGLRSWVLSEVRVSWHGS
jgi:hypothetical protein